MTANGSTINLFARGRPPLGGIAKFGLRNQMPFGYFEPGVDLLELVPQRSTMGLPRRHMSQTLEWRVL